MRSLRKLALPCALLLALALTPLTASRADDGSPSPDTGYSRSGVLAAIGCGVYVFAIVTAPPAAGLFAGAISLCGYMILDAWASTDPH